VLWSDASRLHVVDAGHSSAHAKPCPRLVD